MTVEMLPDDERTVLQAMERLGNSHPKRHGWPRARIAREAGLSKDETDAALSKLRSRRLVKLNQTRVSAKSSPFGAFTDEHWETTGEGLRRLAGEDMPNAKAASVTNIHINENHGAVIGVNSGEIVISMGVDAAAIESLLQLLIGQIGDGRADITDALLSLNEAVRELKESPSPSDKISKALTTLKTAGDILQWPILKGLVIPFFMQLLKS